MKKYTIIIATFLSILMLSVSGQEIKKDRLVIPLSNPGEAGFLKVGGFNCCLNVIGYSGQDVIIETSTEVNDPNKISHLENGLKRINASNMRIEAEEKDNLVEVSTGMGKARIYIKIKVPRNFSVELTSTFDGDINISDVYGEINANNYNGPIMIHNAKSSISASTLSGGIFVHFKEINPEASMTFSAMEGNIDIELPANTNADLKLKNSNGHVYTNFELKIAGDEKIKTKSTEDLQMFLAEETLLTKLNDGGPLFSFTNYFGDIIIRKE